jgi:hypothetical protein
MTATGIRKVALPRETVDQVKDMAWRNHVSASQVVRDIVEEYRRDPAAFKELPDMDGTLSGSLTIYVPDDPWYAARDIAYHAGRTPISVIIRKGLRARLESKKGRMPIPAEA